MKTTSRSFSTALTTGVLGLVMALGLTSVGIGAASAASGTSDTTSARSVVGKSDAGKITSTVVGKTSDGGRLPVRSPRPASSSATARST